jgi:hypothetical protein
VKALEELNAWLADQCVAYAKRTRHPEFRERTIFEVFEEERPRLMPFLGTIRRLHREADARDDDMPDRARPR